MKSLFVSSLTATFGVITASSVYAIPLETSNQPLNDIKVSVGTDYKTNNSQQLSQIRPAKTVDTRDNTELTHYPARTVRGHHLPAGWYVNNPLNNGSYHPVPDQFVNCGCPASVGGNLIADKSGNYTLCEITKAINNEKLSFYTQTMVKTGGNTAILGGYDGGIKSAYAAGYLRTGDLSSTLGLDKGGLRGSLAYSIGSLSPFVALQNSQTHLGVDFRVNNTVSANVSYRTDGAYVFGLRLDSRQDFNKIKVVETLMPKVKTPEINLPVVKPLLHIERPLVKPTEYIQGRG